mmetsp:Transcript_8833/g.8195  ORF Transcript_8833/g.8195 Transcript_8833/m.8195 type:complete len:85 (-) Transcript_8833:2169-2423(-)
MQCLQCQDGFYLLSYETRSYGSSYNYAYCVPDCPLAHHQYVNDPIHGTCQNCGTNCIDCTLKYGCVDCDGGTSGFSLVNQQTSA